MLVISPLEVVVAALSESVFCVCVCVCVSFKSTCKCPFLHHSRKVFSTCLCFFSFSFCCCRWMEEFKAAPFENKADGFNSRPLGR